MIKIINNNVKLKIPLLIIFVAFVVAMWIDFAWTDISILQIKGIDEYAFHGSLLTMYKGIMSFDIRGVFSYGFYSYGSIYWILNVIIAFPFLDEVGEPLAIILPRIFSSLFMIFSLYLVVKVVAQNGSNTYKQVFILFTLLLMPGIWSMGTFFHPDFMMSALLLLSIYYLSRSKVIGDNSYWLSIIIWSFAISVKIQAVTFAPVIILVVMFEIRRSIDILDLIKILALTVLLILACFILLNPYVLHPIGAEVWWRHLLVNLGSNANNHGTVGDVGLLDKLNIAITNSYIWYPSFVLLLMLSIRYIVKDWVNNNLTIISMVSIFIIVNTFYLLVFVNKAWPHYYLTIFLFIPILISQILESKSRLFIAFIVLFTVVPQLFFNGTKLIGYFANRMGPNPTEYQSAMKFRQEVKRLVANQVNNNSVLVISPYTPFPIKEMGLPYKNVRIIYGALSKSILIARNIPTRSQHDEATHVLLRKNDVYFVEDELGRRTNNTEYLEAKKMIEQWNSGKGDFVLVNQSSCCIMYKRKL